MPHYRVRATVTATVTEKWSVMSERPLTDAEVVAAISSPTEGVQVECDDEQIVDERDREFGPVEEM